MNPPALLGILTLLVGCAQYDILLVEPAEFAQTLSSEGAEFVIEPLEYRAAEVGERLGMQIENPTDEPVTLLSERSYVLAPSGETHPMRGETIAPHSFVRFLLPPAPPRVYAEPHVGLGIGVGHAHGYHHGLHSHWYDPWPSEYRIVDPDGPYWNWKTGVVRLRLVYDINGQYVEHELAFERVRIE